jgi:dipeptidyl aminopeptidase/acylaminoacyl peptidase
MSRTSSPLFFLAALLLALAGCAAPPPATPPSTAAPAPATLPPPAAMRVEGVPPIPAASMTAIKRYSDVAGHGFVDWHPTRREMLIVHRPPGASTAQIYRVASPGATPEQLTSGPDPVTTARWEPRLGRYIVFARSSGGDEAFQLYRLDPQTRQAVPFTPSGQRHALAGWLERTGQALVASVPLDRTAAGGTRPTIETTLTLLDPLNPEPGRKVVAVLPGGGWFGAEFSPDGSQLAMTRYVAATHSEVWLLDVASGQRKRVLPADNEPNLRAAHLLGGWTPDGKSLYVTSDRASEFRELMRLDLATGALARLTADTPWDVGQGDVDAGNRLLAITVNVDGRDELRLFDNRTGQPVALPQLPPGSVSRVLFHRATGELAVAVNSARAPSQVFSVDPARASAAPTPWTTPTMPPGLDLSALPDQQIVRWKSFDGRPISGVLTLPPPRFTGKRPVVMVMHGGPESQSKVGWQGRLNYFVQERGIAVLEPNVRGSSGYGKTFLDLDNGRLREDSVKDMASAIDWIATQPNLDASKVVVTGGSYGGYMALAAATRLSGRIAGAASSVGISNFVTFLENTESYRRDLRRVEYGDERDPAMRDFLISISPLTNAAMVKKPLLVAQGKNDPRVPWTESEQIVRKLQEQKTPVWYLLADNEGHGFSRRENADFYFATFAKFLDETVLR